MITSIVLLYTCVASKGFFQNCAALVPPVERRLRLLEPLLYFSQKFTPEKKHSLNNLPSLFFSLVKPAFPVSNTVRYWFAKFVLQLFGGLYDCSFQASGTKASASIISDIKAMVFFFWATNDPPSPFFLFHYLLSPWLQEALHIIASSHIVRPRISFLPWLPPTTWTFPAFVARRSGYLIVKDTLWKVLSKQIVMAFITLDSVFSHPKASCWHLFEDLVRSRIKQSCVEMHPPPFIPPAHASWLLLLLLLWGLSGSVTSQCILYCFSMFLPGELAEYTAFPRSLEIRMARDNGGRHVMEWTVGLEFLTGRGIQDYWGNWLTPIMGLIQWFSNWGAISGTWASSDGSHGHE